MLSLKPKASPHKGFYNSYANCQKEEEKKVAVIWWKKENIKIEPTQDIHEDCGRGTNIVKW